MKTVALLFALLSTSALAAEPATIILPTPVVSALVQYLAQRPYGEVAQMMGAMQACVSAQVPDAHGVTVSHGECPAVTAALAKPEPAKH